ncbi:hypothetical protein [Actinophytocola sp.]|uniref:hypothetical protein n=1 Tax=Actinophytocola sp. TaxID=1872138 RepID=UPI002D80F845|nr:hypothetical protein [Actinophytocola sp.]HET9142699.1 hypothetical protein [Actinophytocola sp.]
MVAVEVMVLRPPKQTGRAKTGPWPVLAIVLDEPNELIEPRVRPLFALLDQPTRADRITVVAGRSGWSALGTGSLLQLAVHATAPVRFDLHIILPTQPVLGFTDLLAGGPTIALTNRGHAGRLAAQRVPVRDALAELVLLGDSPSTDLSALVGVS